MGIRLVRHTLLYLITIIMTFFVIYFLNINVDHNKTLSKIYVGIAYHHSWSIITPYLDKKHPFSHSFRGTKLLVTKSSLESDRAKFITNKFIFFVKSIFSISGKLCKLALPKVKNNRMSPRPILFYFVGCKFWLTTIKEINNVYCGLNVCKRRMLKPPPFNPRTYISRYL